VFAASDAGGGQQANSHYRQGNASMHSCRITLQYLMSAFHHSCHVATHCGHYVRSACRYGGPGRSPLERAAEESGEG
jgi:hypothetical protein